MTNDSLMKVETIAFSNTFDLHKGIIDLENNVSSFSEWPFYTNKPISNNVVGATSKCSDQPAHTRSLIRAFASRLGII